jgi:hypothetical protein
MVKLSVFQELLTRSTLRSIAIIQNNIDVKTFGNDDKSENVFAFSAANNLHKSPSSIVIKL